MTDRLTAEQRRRAMQAVKSKNTGIELALRRALWAKGYRYRLHYSKLPGKPDIVFVSKRLAVFCDSDFWHGYDWKHRKHDIKSNQEFWHQKIERNIERDCEVTEQLLDLGWTVLRFWGHEIEQNLKKCVGVTADILDKRGKGRTSVGRVYATKGQKCRQR